MSVTDDTAEPITQPVRRVARKVEERGTVIVNALAGGVEMPVEELVASISASPTTVRRDLRRLERLGLVRRTHGLVALAQSSAFEPFMQDPGFRDQVHLNATEKRRIAEAAAALVQSGESIALAPGTTVAQMPRALRSQRNLTVVTNALNIAMDLSRQKHVTVHLVGGYVGGNWLTLLGPKAVEFIYTMYTDKFFFGANGVDPEHGITDRHQDEAAVNSAMARQTRQRIVLAHHSKLGKTARYLVCRITEVNTIITDTGASDELIGRFQDLGIEVLRV